MSDSPKKGGALPTFISFSAEITPVTVQALISVFADTIQKGARDIHLLLNTPGGHVSPGIQAYNTLMGMPIDLTTHNVGTVNSIGNAIFLAGEKRYACKASSFMFHGVSINFGQPARFEEKDLRERLDNLTNDQGLIAQVINDRTNIDTKEVEGLFLQAAFVGSDEACKKGIVHEVRDVSIPDGAPFFQLNFQSAK